MPNGLRLDIGLISSGWAPIHLTAPSVHLEFLASFTPFDSIGDLAGATASLLDGLPEQLVKWNTEPEQFDFHFTTTGDVTRLEIRRFPDHRRRSRHAQEPVAVIEEARLAISARSGEDFGAYRD